MYRFILFLLCFCLYACDSNPAKSVLQAGEQDIKAVDSSAKATLEKGKEEMAAKLDPSEKPSSDASPRPAFKNAPTGLTQGIDISMFQGDEIEMLNRNQDNLSFIFCKATEGITYTDPDFSQNWSMIKEKGFIRGSYHFYRTADAPVPQADHYANAISDIQDNDLPPVVDFEGGGIDKSQSVATIQRNLLIFLNQLERKTGRTPMIYTDIPSGNKYLNSGQFAQYALWIALYEDVQSPELPKAWAGKRWTFWQRTSKYQLDGKNNDFDLYNGNLQSLNLFIKNY